jgi:predicted ATP-binding protein involved in virulence
VYRIFVLNPHLGADAFDKTPGIALIDETDMHLHPKWQGRIIEDLRSAFPVLQFVFTTHSPFVVQSLRNSRIIDLDAQHVRDVGDYVKKSIPEVAEEYMGMEEIERSPYFMEQVKAAEEYFVLLKKSPDLDVEELKKVTEKLNNFEIRYDRDPAFVALLRAERLTSDVDKI